MKEFMEGQFVTMQNEDDDDVRDLLIVVAVKDDGHTVTVKPAIGDGELFDVPAAILDS